MNNENYTVDWFINFFGAIPEDKWISNGDLWDGWSTRCAVGHCLKYGDIEHTPESQALVRVMTPLRGANSWWIYDINNGDDPRYQQPTPKLRILAALHDIKRQQEEAAERFELRPLNLSKQPKEASCVQV